MIFGDRFCGFLFSSCYLLCRERGDSAFFFSIYIVLGSLFLFVSWQEDLFFQLAASVISGCCFLGFVLFSQFWSAYLVLAYSFALIFTLFSVGCVSIHF